MRTEALKLLLAWTGWVLAVAVAAARPASAVTLDVLNDPVPGTDRIVLVQGEPVEVYFEVDPAERTSPSDQLQLRRIDDGDVVSYAVRGEALSGTVSLSTTPANALGWLEVVYVLHPTGVVLATSPENVLVTAEAPPEPLARVEVPSLEAPTLQAAIDLVADGGIVAIAAGVYDVDQPIMVIGKSVTIQGAGSSRGAEPGEGEVTWLAAPAPTEVVDAELAMGVITYIGGGGVLKDLDLSGGDACVVARDLEGTAEPLVVEDVCLSNTGRGILFKGSATLAVQDAAVENCLWNGIVFSPLTSSACTFSDVFIQDANNIGLLAVNCWAYYEDVFVTGCTGGGGIVVVNSLFIVTDSEIYANSLAGIAAFESQGLIEDSRIWATTAPSSGPWEDKWGDGIHAWLCPLVYLSGNDIDWNARVGVVNFGSTVHMVSNSMMCNLGDMQSGTIPAGAFGPSNPPAPVSAEWQDLGGNKCGCPFPFDACVAESAGMEPPAPLPTE